MSNEVFAGMGLAALVKNKLWMMPALIGMTGSSEGQTGSFIREVGSTVIALLIVGAVTGGIAGVISSYQTREVVSAMDDRMDRLGSEMDDIEKRVRDMRREIAQK